MDMIGDLLFYSFSGELTVCLNITGHYMPRARTFKCRKLGCWGITPACCIGRQYKRGHNKSHYTNDYPECSVDSCPQGAKIAKLHPGLVPEIKLHGPRKSIKCRGCGTVFKPWLKEQTHCDRDCVDIARRRDRSASFQQTPAPDTASLPSPIRHAGAMDPITSPVVPGELVSSEVPA